MPKSDGLSLHDCLEKEVDTKYFVNWQARKGKQIYLKGDEITPCSLIEVRTDKGDAERKQNKAIFGIDRNARNKDTSMYIATNKAKTNCLTGAIHAVNLLVIRKDDELMVRMPTPIECERFQGFPDDRTLVPRKNRMMSDTQRYKQAGNAVTVNVIAYIF